MMFNAYPPIDGMMMFENVSVGRESIPTAGLHSTGIYVFVEQEIDQALLDTTIFELQRKLSCSRIKMHVYDTKNGYYLNPYNDDLQKVDDIWEHVMRKTGEGAVLIDEASYSVMSEKLVFSERNKKTGIRCGSDGREYVRKGSGNWFPVALEGSDGVFQKAFLFGWFGWYQYSRGNTLMAVIYALTGGLMGVGYVADLITFLWGNARDAQGYYYAPLSDKKKAAGCILLSVLIAVIVDFIYFNLWCAAMPALTAFIAGLLKT